MKHGIAAGVAVVALAGAAVDAGMKQMEIKGSTSLTGSTVSYDNGAKAYRGGGSDSRALLDVDLDFKMKFSQDVSARIDLELDNAMAGDSTFTGKTPSTATVANGNRFGFGVDQAYFKMSDFLFKNFSLTVGKQNLNFSLRDNRNFSWGWWDPIAVVGTYSTRDVDVRLYWAKYNDESTLAGSTSTNDKDQDLIGSYLEYWLSDDSLAIGYLNYFTNQATSTDIFHYGLGIDYFHGEALELYAEAAGQSINGPTAATDGSAFQVTAGAQYAFTQFDLKPTFNLEYYVQSGADKAKPAWQKIGAGGARGADNQSLFVESMGRDSAVNDLGFGVGLADHGGAGYSVIRLNGWLSPTKSLKAGLGIHIFKDEDKPVTKDDMGIEVDLTGAWKYSPDVTFRAGAFDWTGAETDGATALASGSYENVIGGVIGSSLEF